MKRLALVVLISACATPASPVMAPPQGGWHLGMSPGAAKPRSGAAKETGDKPKWDVGAPPGPKITVEIDTDEGTWMSLDVSPDGKEIVFDLLGDIYVVPIEGGNARALTEGMAWDMQPRYSPDGTWIAFTSDRSGGDNIWAMRRDGSDVRQITAEDVRLVNSPAWTPDGQFIAVRKHFTHQRSNGAGEIWLYHRSGGKGVQVVEKANDQKDLGEPAFSPDGRYLYYSQDVTPGAVFEYNKDPYQGIYVIKRLDRAEAHTISFVHGPGGAVRPTPSPDGTWLAFVRRVGTDTALFVHDVVSGRERLLWRGLERDMQETWAIHGVYPTMAWTPDSQAIVVWAGGKLHRVDTKTGEARVIPFRVRGKREIVTALRRPVEVHPERFDTRMLRWVNVAPDGKAVVYQALGKLYIRELPSGQVRRLTSDENVFEHEPSWSRDGRFVVYTTWNDDALGTVRVVARSGGRGRVVTTTPGHYVEPVFTPDGATIVYRAVEGGYVSSPMWSHNTGMFAVPAAGGASRRIVRDGSQPHFGADPDRVFFLASEPSGNEMRQVLKSVGLAGNEERTHVRTEQAVRIRVSPDSRWVAFQELFHAYVAPLPMAGKPVELGPKTESIPVAKVTRDAGDYLQWSGDGRALYWSLGPELFTRDLKDTFAFLDGAPATLPAAPESGINIGFSIASDRPGGQIALTGARIVTMKGDEVIERGTIVITENRITAIGTSAQVAVPKGALTVDIAGATVIPGLVDVHAHGPQGSANIIPQRNWHNDATLAFGVTTIHDPSNHTPTIFAAAELARAGLITAPRIFSTGTILYGAKSSFSAVINSVDDAISHLRRMKAVGAFSVKSYNQPRRDQRQQVLAAARELDMMVVPEGGSLYHHNMSMVVDGHTGVEHSLPVPNVYADVVQLWSKSEVGYTPTIVVGYGGMFGEMYWYQESDVFASERLRRFVPPFAYEGQTRRRIKASEGDWNHIRIAKACKKLLDAGVRVHLGAHGQREGLAAHWELWSFVQGGMTPHEALRAGTLFGAAYLGMDRDIGSLEVGKLADLVVIDGNPLRDIRESERVRYVMVNGRLYDAATMSQIGNHPKARPPYFWEKN